MVAVVKRKRKAQTEEQKLTKQIRKVLPTSIIEVELNTTSDHRKLINQSMEHARVIRNTLMGSVYKQYQQMIRTKKYKKTYKKYVNNLKELNNSEDKKIITSLNKEKKQLQLQLEMFRSQFGVTFDHVRKEAEILQKRFSKANAVIGLKMAERVWLSMERILFGNADTPRFIGKEYFCSIEGKQNERCIMLKFDENEQFYVSFEGHFMPLIIKSDDLFIQETLLHVKTYMQHPDEIDKNNVKLYQQEKKLLSTYRVKYNRIVRKKIRGRQRFFVQIVLEGNPFPKRKKDGSFRHSYGKGRMGGDIGTQSIAFTTANSVLLKNLAERTKKSRERKMMLLQRKMDRSRRAMNPDCFDEKGRAIKKMHTKSNRYMRYQQQLKNLHRIMAENRKYAHNEDVNYLRSLGNEVFIETMNIKALQKKAKETTKNQKTGKYNRKKRYGKSILNRSPGYFIQQLKYRFEMSDAIFHEVNTWTFKASQYDHMLDDTNKKQLSQRWHLFEDGTKIQRDLYSSFLLYCSNNEKIKPDKNLCDQYFEDFKHAHDTCIQRIQTNQEVVKNSGIKLVKSK